MLNLIAAILGGVGVFSLSLAVMFFCCDGFRFLGCASLSLDNQKLFKVLALSFAGLLIPAIILLIIAATKDPDSESREFYVGCGNYDSSSGAGGLLVRPFVFATVWFLLW